jgi:hypothetical protein
MAPADAASQPPGNASVCAAGQAPQMSMTVDGAGRSRAWSRSSASPPRLAGMRLRPVG